MLAKSSDGSEDFYFFFGYRSPLSNFFAYTFELDGKIWNCGEQYYQYMKALHFEDLKSQEAIMATRVQKEQKRLGRGVVGFDETEWTRVCYEYMGKMLRAKFTRNTYMRSQLKGTGTATLVEASPYDKRWGNGLWATDEGAVDRTQWKGQNRLGECLMLVRSELFAGII